MLKPYVALTNLFAASRREDGQTMAEYGVVLAVIALGIIVALGFLSGAISEALDKVTAILKGGS
jgi:Flp pilus assembly pilin Flp